MLGRYQSNPGIDHWKVVKKIPRNLQGTKEYMLTYRRSEDLEIIGYSDSDYASCKDTRKSTSGYLFMLAGGLIISWRSHKQSLVASSTNGGRICSMLSSNKSCNMVQEFHFGTTNY